MLTFIVELFQLGLVMFGLEANSFTRVNRLEYVNACIAIGDLYFVFFIDCI